MVGWVSIDVQFMKTRKKKKKKNRYLGPRRKRMKRPARLQSAQSWVGTYRGKNLVRGYSRWFGVDQLCAVLELRMLGISICADYEQKVRDSVLDRAKRAKQNARRRAEKEREQKASGLIYGLDFDDTFAYIAGFTSGGCPFGVTWEQHDQLDPTEQWHDRD